MSGFLNNMHEHHQQRKDRREDRREERREHGGRHGDHDNYDNHESQYRGQRRHDDDDDDEPRRPQSYQSQSQGQGRGVGGYAPPPGPPPSARGSASAFALQGGLDRGDFASDADIERMVTKGEFNGRQTRQGYEYGEAGGDRENAYGRYDAPSGPPPGQGYGGRANEHGRYDAPSGPPPGQGYGERANEHGRYDAPSGPPLGRGYQSQQPHQGYGSGGAGYGGGPERQNPYGSQQPQGRSQYDSTQAPHSGYDKSQGNTPSGGFSVSRDGEERYGGPPNDRNEPPRRGEAASFYNQQGPSGQGERYAHLAGIAQEHGDDDPEVYRRATQGLHDRIQTQAQSRRPNDKDDDIKAHVDAHRKAYEEDDRGPMDADTIGAAAAMEAFKQTAAAAGSTNAPAGAFKTGKASGGFSSKPGRAARDEEEVEEEEVEETTAARAGASGGMQDKLMALAMSHAGKLFDKKNAGSSGGDKSQDKAQAMQSAAATAMQLFGQYQSKGKLESGDMSKVIGLAMNLL